MNSRLSLRRLYSCALLVQEAGLFCLWPCGLIPVISNHVHCRCELLLLQFFSFSSVDFESTLNEQLLCNSALLCQQLEIIKLKIVTDPLGADLDRRKWRKAKGFIFTCLSEHSFKSTTKRQNMASLWCCCRCILLARHTRVEIDDRNNNSSYLQQPSIFAKMTFVSIR